MHLPLPYDDQRPNQEQVRNQPRSHQMTDNVVDIGKYRSHDLQMLSVDLWISPEGHYSIDMTVDHRFSNEEVFHGLITMAMKYAIDQGLEEDEE